jgi:hypothetical protein
MSEYSTKVSENGYLKKYFFRMNVLVSATYITIIIAESIANVLAYDKKGTYENKNIVLLFKVRYATLCYYKQSE